MNTNGNIAKIRFASQKKNDRCIKKAKIRWLETLPPTTSAPQKLLDLSLEMLCTIGLDGNFKQIAPMWTECLGWSIEDLQSQPYFSWIHPEDRAATRECLWTLLEGDLETVTYKNRFLSRNRIYRWLRWQVTFCRDRRLFYVNVQDLGERPGCTVARPQPHSNFNSPEEHFRLLVEGVKDYAIYMLDRHGRIVSWNQGATRINGWSEREILGESIDRFFPPEQVATGTPVSLLDRAILNGRVEYENWRMRRDGSRFWAHVTISSLRNESGELRGFATVTRDITERKQSSEALQTAHDELEKRVEERTTELKDANAKLQEEVQIRKRTATALRQSKNSLKQQARTLEKALRKLQTTQAQLIHTEKMLSLGQLVAGVAHEINNPVNFIHGNLSYLDEYARELIDSIDLYRQHGDCLAPEIQDRLQELDLDFIRQDIPKILSSMKVGTQRITHIVRSLRNFSRYDESQLKKVDLHEGIESALSLLSYQLNNAGNRIQVVKEYDELPLVECYASQLNQVFMNVFANAIDAFPIGSEGIEGVGKAIVCIQTQVKEKTVAIHISDNGIGMSEEVRTRTFDPFFTTKPIGQGTGLGLSIGYDIVVNQHGGTFNCISTPGQGTTFSIEIPVEAIDRGV
ncbi:PAS domain S-box protein [Oscillatoriales cyanobacterium LEGE 11467]|uniref:histidine kinase n=1 Tax=Zarconia navalis LEGE 11467 TaxID=1828826 RepID=A0A928VYR1_9CYAN|nr:PAS domain S-box protein [Zarconia navalis]MBE9042642.1 PAS domain S-box protein [Zarconia navalis LEGE 11467]